ncbi:MAG: alpha/beta hydrolase [Pseudomonadota bacterium]
MTSDPNQFPEWYEGGNPNGSTLILLHGFTATWRQYKPLLPFLEPHHRVIIPTLPGHVGGLPLKKRASPVSISEAFAEQLKARGISDAHFVGCSLGGWMVFEMARFGLARSSLGLSPAGAWRNESDMVDFMRKGRASFKLLPYLIPLMKIAVGVPALRKLLLAGGSQHGDRMPAADAREHLDKLQRLTIIEEYMDENIKPMQPLPPDCKTPLRVTWGEFDKVLPFEKFGQPLLDLLGLDSYVVLPDCGHDPSYDNPEFVAKTILEFTREVDASLAK